MRKKTIDKILKLFAGFRKTLEVRPPMSTMYKEVRMMNFKIRPLRGDLTVLDLRDDNLIETLWQLGKLDEFFQKEFKKLTPVQQEVFFNFFNDMHYKLQQDLNHINLKVGRTSPLSSSVFEMEIIKEKKADKKIN